VGKSPDWLFNIPGHGIIPTMKTLTKNLHIRVLCKDLMEYENYSIDNEKSPISYVDKQPPFPVEFGFSGKAGIILPENLLNFLWR